MNVPDMIHQQHRAHTKIKQRGKHKPSTTHKCLATHDGPSELLETRPPQAAQLLRELIKQHFAILQPRIFNPGFGGTDSQRIVMQNAVIGAPRSPKYWFFVGPNTFD